MTARSIIAILLSLIASNLWAQRFYNLTADEVKVDSVIPVVSIDMELPANHRDSVYTAEILYPEYIDMPEADVNNYLRLVGNDIITPAALPVVSQNIIYSRKQPSMLFSLTPVVYRDGKYQYLVSFMLKVSTESVSRSKTLKAEEEGTTERYAQHSVLATGRWAKISVASTGFYELTEDVIRKAGFKDINKVRVYGYGGNLVPEVLNENYIISHDDLKPVDMTTINGHHVFFAEGPVSFASKGAATRIRNPYSDKGYYFITENAELNDTTEEALLAQWRSSYAKHYTLYENDGYAWFKGGRNLVDNVATTTDKPRAITLNVPQHSNYAAGGTLTVVTTAGASSSYTIHLNDSLLGTCKISLANYDKAGNYSRTYRIKNFKDVNTLKLTCTSGGPLRLDYAMIYVQNIESDINLQQTAFPAAEYVYNITNQDHHADENVDMVIIIPTSQKLLGQAERLKRHHEEHDGFTVRIVPADELYNEFSSGTPDVSAYRRYMKMMYDRAADDETKMPRYLLLFGDCVWDNRMLTVDCRKMDVNDWLLCFESESSYNEVSCYVSDDFNGMLDDNESIMTDSYYLGTPDIGVGRFPVTTVEDAKVMVDKTINYATNDNIGAWQNTLLFMGDDGNDNLHMRDVNIVAEDVINNYPGYNVRKIMWDAYQREKSSTGARYPEVSALIKKQQQEGALIMDYAGHGSATAISHEYVLELADFYQFTNQNLPLWITASCDVGPYDGVVATIGENVVTNPKGGGIAFYGTTRTVYANYNKHINDAFVKNVLLINDGKRNTLGDATRIAKTELVKKGLDRTVNKLQYALLGDPALALNTPILTCVVDSINGQPVDTTEPLTLHANSKVSISGHINNNGTEVNDFTGIIKTLVRDNRELVTCYDNEHEASEKFQFYDRSKSLYNGTDSVRNGRFNVKFVIPRDINYSNETGLITLFAYTPDGNISAHGESAAFTLGGSEEVYNDSIGPSLYCYLNSTTFQNGGNVNATPLFVAELSDNNGINASGTGIGHDMQLIIDNDKDKTFTLNDNFRYDFGSYTSGTTYMMMPELSVGMHTLQFRAWDILNNPSTTTLSFNVVNGLEPHIIDVNVTQNPARTGTTFVVTHDRPGSDVNIEIEIFDNSGRLLHKIQQSAVAGLSTTTIPWDLRTAIGACLQTGIYLYRVNITCDNSTRASKTKKLIVVRNG